MWTLTIPLGPDFRARARLKVGAVQKTSFPGWARTTIGKLDL